MCSAWDSADLCSTPLANELFASDQAIEMDQPGPLFTDVQRYTRTLFSSFAYPVLTHFYDQQNRHSWVNIILTFMQLVLKVRIVRVSCVEGYAFISYTKKAIYPSMFYVLYGFTSTSNILVATHLLSYFSTRINPNWVETIIFSTRLCVWFHFICNFKYLLIRNNARTLFL